MNEIDIETLRKLLRYEPETGKLFWRKRTPDMFENGQHTAQHRCNIWNSRYEGKEALATVGKNGRKDGVIFFKRFKSHRVIWALVNGKWPTNQIDHINHVPSDNRINNLREVTNQENAWNQSLSPKNTSGYTGVSWHKVRRKWYAGIRVDGTSKHLGSYDHLHDAVKSRQKANIKYGFHENHGKDS